MRFSKKNHSKKQTDLVTHNQRGIGVKYNEKLATLKGFLLLHRDFWKKNHSKKHTDLVAHNHIGVKYNEKLAVRRPQTSCRILAAYKSHFIYKKCIFRLRPCWRFWSKIDLKKLFYLPTYIYSSDTLRENFLAMESLIYHTTLFWGGSNVLHPFIGRLGT